MAATLLDSAVPIGVAIALLLTASLLALRFYLEADRLKLRVETLEAETQALRLEGEQSRSEAARWQEEHRKAEGELIASRAVADRVPGLERDQAELRVRAETLREDAATMRERAERAGALEADLRDVRERLATALEDKRGLQEKIQADAVAYQEKTEALTALRGDIEAKLKVIAQEALQANQTLFLQSSNELLTRHQASAVAEMENRKTAVEALVKPIQEMLKDYKEGLANIEKAHTQSAAALSQELKNVVETQQTVRAEASKLVMALRASPKTRGRWGEVTLKNVLELSGLSEHCDFDVERSFEHEDGRLRPDVIIKLPGNRALVVDAKTPLAGYLDAIEAVDEAERERHLALHAAQLKTHVQQLGAKAYWDRLSTAPDFVVMFVPGENFFGAAAERAPDLFEFAAAKRVVITTPATLLALAKAVAFGWRQEKVADNARRVHQLGSELYKRLSTMGGHISGIHGGLTAAVKKYNSFVGSLEASVMPQARRFQELEVEGTSSPLPQFELIDTEPRLLTPGRDIVLPPLENPAPA